MKLNQIPYDHYQQAQSKLLKKSYYKKLIKIFTTVFKLMNTEKS